jgi:hypothetical protein
VTPTDKAVPTDEDASTALEPHATVSLVRDPGALPIHVDGAARAKPHAQQEQDTTMVDAVEVADAFHAEEDAMSPTDSWKVKYRTNGHRTIPWASVYSVATLTILLTALAACTTRHEASSALSWRHKRSAEI